MSIKKKIFLALMCIIVVALNAAVFLYQGQTGSDALMTMTIASDVSDNVQMFYGDDSDSFSEDNSSIAAYGKELAASEKKTEMTFDLRSESAYIRIDLGAKKGTWKIYDLNASCGSAADNISFSSIQSNVMSRDIEEIEEKDGACVITTKAGDPFIVIKLDAPNTLKAGADKAFHKTLLYKIFALVLIDGFMLFVIIFRRKVLALPVELFHSRKLIFKLARNDFKTRFAGSYLGIIWAFIQPVVTILVYWFVFSVGFRSGTMDKVPFVLYLIAGIVPWFYFQDMLSGGTNALMEYSYLVKKVVFKISVLPMVKAISAFFVHGFFVIVTLVIFTAYGMPPTFYTLQLVYYFICMFVLALGICYATSAIVIFFRDLTQIINIVLQVGVWMIPIMWDLNIVPENLHVIFKLNPMYYVVNGYRDSLYNATWFWEHPGRTLYFWAVTLVVFALGTLIFKRLKVHFADVL